MCLFLCNLLQTLDSKFKGCLCRMVEGGGLRESRLIELCKCVAENDVLAKLITYRYKQILDQIIGY